LLDLPEMTEGDGATAASSHLAARREIRMLLESIGLNAEVSS
jgi:hypothetical protein